MCTDSRSYSKRQEPNSVFRVLGENRDFLPYKNERNHLG